MVEILAKKESFLKNKRRKKRMRQIGTVEVPQKHF